jgi:hypothetical protein
MTRVTASMNGTILGYGEVNLEDDPVHRLDERPHPRV